MSTASSPVVLAIDAGTGSARVLAFDLNGTVVAAASREWTHAAAPGSLGGTSFDTARGWDAIASASRDVVARLDAAGGREIAAVAASSMREGFVLYNAAGEEIWACPNTDGRARTQAERLVAEGVADRIYELGGDWVSITAPARLRWLREEQPEILDSARHLGMLSDWVSYRLTGEFTTDPTCGSSSALFDLSQRTWSSELADAVGVDPRILPPVLECGTIAGTVSEAAASATGIPAGTLVAIGGADTQLALHGLGARSGTPTVVGGTFWQTTAITDTAIIDPQRRLRTLCHVTPNTWMIEGIGFLSGLAMRWFRDAFCPDAKDLARTAGVSGFDVMESWASEIPAGSNGLVGIFANTMIADAWHHAAPAFVGFDINDPDRFNRGTSVRAIEEAAAYVARSHLETLAELTHGSAIANRRITFTAGSSSGVLWPRILADVTGLETALSVVPEATSFGAARLAAASAGLNLAPAGNTADTVVPQSATVAEYNGHYRHWLDVYRAQVAATTASGTTPLFTPPGGLAYRPTVAGAPPGHPADHKPSTTPQTITTKKETIHG